MKQYSDFTSEILTSIAASLGLPYEQMAAIHLGQPRPFIRPKVIRLMMTDDLRKWKRAWRIYHTDNGPGAPRSYLSGIVSQYRFVVAKCAFAVATNKVLEQRATENGLIQTRAGVA